MKFESARFITSALLKSELPTLRLDNAEYALEIAFVGRSNVGKSSLINSLLGQKGLAKTSSTPGKTQRINYFLVDERFFLVDLPGYGFSKAPKEEVVHWSNAIDDYINTRTTLKLILLLIDIRREPSFQDLQIAQWAVAKGIPFVTIFTKKDKIKRKVLPKVPGSLKEIAYSSLEPHDRKNLIRLIEEALKWDI